MHMQVICAIMLTMFMTFTELHLATLASLLPHQISPTPPHPLKKIPELMDHRTDDVDFIHVHLLLSLHNKFEGCNFLWWWQGVRSWKEIRIKSGITSSGNVI